MYNNFDDAKYQNKHSMYNAGNSVFSGNVTAGMADEINFYQWLNRNYSKSGIFSSQKSMQNYLNGGSGQEKLFKNIIQGKGHEHDWMSTQRRNPLNIDKMYDAGDIANRPGSDVTQISVFTGKEKAVQIKAYGSDNIPDLHNTPTDMTVVVNAEKADAVAKKGYIDVEVFGTAKDIKNKTQSRLNRIKNGKIYTKHTLSSTLGTAAVSGIGGAIIGSVIEAVGSHRAYKNGEISEEKYATEIIKSGAQAGTTAAITTVATIPLAAGLAAAGLASTPVLIPLSIAVSSVVDKIIAPAFKRGVYKDAKDSIDHLQESVMEPMNCLVHTSLDSVNNTSEFVSQLSSGFEVMNNNFSESQRLLNESMDLLNLF